MRQSGIEISLMPRPGFAFPNVESTFQHALRTVQESRLVHRRHAPLRLSRPLGRRARQYIHGDRQRTSRFGARLRQVPMHAHA